MDEKIVTLPGVRVNRESGQTEAGWKPTHRHLKTGELYRRLMTGTLTTDMAQVVVYQNNVGRIWVRPAVEFNDTSRFEPLGKNEEGPEVA